MGDDLVTWLLGVLDEIDGEDFHNRSEGCGTFNQFPCDCSAPASTLADVAGKRGIVALHQPGPETSRMYGRFTRWCPTCGEIADGQVLAVPCPCPTLRLLASAYRDRPGYREEWAPEKA